MDREQYERTYAAARKNFDQAILAAYKIVVDAACSYPTPRPECEDVRETMLDAAQIIHDAHDSFTEVDDAAATSKIYAAKILADAFADRSLYDAIQKALVCGLHVLEL